jgi:hypothetical protein
MQQSFKRSLQSAAPLLLNNGQLANPLNPIAQAMKRITRKGKNRTEADLLELAKLEWTGSLYLKGGRVCIPGAMIDACMINAAKKSRRGQQAKAGMYSIDDFLLQFDGPEIIENLWQDDRFRFTANCRPQGKSTVMRTRPIFETWTLDIEIVFNDELLSENDLQEILFIGGRDVGVGNWRPRFGRFSIAP